MTPIVNNYWSMSVSNDADLLANFKAKRAEIGSDVLAKALGVSSATVRSICTDNYAGKPDKVLNKFAQIYIDVVFCPFIEELIEHDNCRTRHIAPRPIWGDMKRDWWDVCQTCQYKGS